MSVVLALLLVAPQFTAISASGFTTAAAAAAPVCTLAHSKQICGTSAEATAGKTESIIVANYADLSNCSFPQRAEEPGNNGRYVVGSVSIDWGDNKPATPGVAGIGTTCPGSTVTNYVGESQPITGTHLYQTAGSYTVTVTLTYLRGVDNTYVNCTTPCVALGSPAQTIVSVRADCAIGVEGLSERDNPCNNVPNGKPRPTRLYVSVENSGRIELQLRTSSSTSGDIVWGIMDGGSLLSESGPVQSGGVTNVDFTLTNSLGLYKLAFGCDENGDGRLQLAEIDPSLSANMDPYTIQTVLASDYNSARLQLAVVASVAIGFPVSRTLLHAFIDGVAPTGSVPTGTIPISAANPSLTHVAGENFAGPGCVAMVRQFTFYENSAVSTSVRDSTAFRTAVQAFLQSKRSEVASFFESSPVAVWAFRWEPWTAQLAFSDPDGNPDTADGDSDLAKSFGTATLTQGSVVAVVHRDLTVQQVLTTGRLEDIYDFDFQRGGLNTLGAAVQLGWSPGRPSGRIYAPLVRLLSSRTDMADVLR